MNNGMENNNNNTLLGLDLLINPSKMKKDRKGDKDELTWYTTELEKFRNDMINKMKTYDPYIHKEGQIEAILHQLWMCHLWGNMTMNELYEKKK